MKPHTIVADSCNGQETTVIREGDKLFVAGHCNIALVELLGDRTLGVKMLTKEQYAEHETRLAASA